MLMLRVTVVLFMLLHSPILAFQLNPATPPGVIIDRQLAALKDGDIGAVYALASPGNKKQSGDVANFSRMVRSGPYRYARVPAAGTVGRDCT